MLRERVDLYAEFDELMTRFVDHWNTLMHHIQDIPGYPTRIEEERAASRLWLAALMEDADSIIHNFTALNLAFTEATGIDLEVSKGVH